VISRVNSLMKNVSDNLDYYVLHDEVNELRCFLVEDLSRFYLKFVKKRAELAGRQELKNIAKITRYVLYNTLVLLSVVAPFSTEYVYQELFSNNNESIFMDKWPKPKLSYINEDLEKEFEIMKETITAILNLREKENIKLRQPLASATVETSHSEVVDTIERLAGLVSSYANVKNIKVVKASASKKEIKPIFSKLGPAFKGNASVIAEELINQDPEKLQKETTLKGEYLLHTDSGMFKILPEHFVIIERALADQRTLQFRYGTVTLDTNITNELKEEFIVRALVRQIQLMRKSEGLTKRDSIDVYVDALPEIEAVMNRNKPFIKSVTKAQRIIFGPQEFLREKELLENTFKLGIKKGRY